MEDLKNILKIIIKDLTDQDFDFELSIPTDLTHGDYTTNVAMQIFPKIKDKGSDLGSSEVKFSSPFQLAEEIARVANSKWRMANSTKEKEKSTEHKVSTISHKPSAIRPEGYNAEALRPGFINFWISEEKLISNISQVISNKEKFAGISKSKYLGKQIMVEYAHPNTHKEMHIGHMRTLITGEAISRFFQSLGATVFRANYQGDIGPHVAKAMWGIQEIMREENLDFSQVLKWNNKDKAHFLGRGYAKGSKLYETGNFKNEIDLINEFLYGKVEGLAEDKLPFKPEEQGKIWDLYKETRQWSLNYYDEFYARFYTKFDQLFMESQMVSKGKKIVLENVGNIFTKDKDGSIIFKGEQYGLHTRVFITQKGNPTYEGKEMGNALSEYEAFKFDKKIHVVANEQTGYFQVVLKALELLDKDKFKDKQYHLSMGMVQLTDRKMSSRTGDILTVDWLIDQVKEVADSLFSKEKLSGEEREKVLERITIGAIKYSVLKTGAKQDVAFDIKTSVSLDGNSGPYIQYTYARTQSLLAKSEEHRAKGKDQKDALSSKLYSLSPEELLLLRLIYQFPNIVQKASNELSPSTICTYLFELAQSFNNFYQKHRIIDPVLKREAQSFRLSLTQAVGIILEQGLNLLGIVAPKRM